MKATSYVLGLLGLLLATALIAYEGAGPVAGALAVAGWGLLVVALFHLLPLILDAAAWWALLPPGRRPHLAAVSFARWIRESVNSLLPVAQIGGDLVGIRLLTTFRVPGSVAAASVVGDVTVGLATQLLFTLIGLGLLLLVSDDPLALTVAYSILAALALVLVALVAFVVMQRRGLFGGLARLSAATLGDGRWISALRAKGARLDSAIDSLYSARRGLLVSGVLRLAAWLVGAGEIWLALHFFGHPVSLAEALMLESLGQAVRAAAFMVPGALGVQEGGYILLGSLLGLDSPVALAISLAKRVRELSLGLPGLLAWQYIEGRRLVKARLMTPARRPSAEVGGVSAMTRESKPT